MGRRLLIRADAGPALGVGHVMRMLALAEAWLELEGAVTLIGEVPSSLVDKAAKLGVSTQALDAPPGTVDDAQRTCARAEAFGADCVAADGYHFSEAWQRAVRSPGRRLLLVDDNAENQAYVADFIVNLNLHADEQMYRQRGSHTRLLLGPRFALIRGEIRRAMGPSRTVPPRASRWLVSMGGSDPANATRCFLLALIEAGSTDIQIEVLVGDSNPRRAEYEALAARAHVPVVVSANVTNVAEPMGRADLALSASGGTIWELGLLGVPAAVLTAADNQRAPAAALEQRGVVVALGDARTSPDGQKWLARLLELSADAPKRASMIAQARALVDGQGALRVVRALQEEHVDAQL